MRCTMPHLTLSGIAKPHDGANVSSGREERYCNSCMWCKAGRRWSAGAQHVSKRLRLPPVSDFRGGCEGVELRRQCVRPFHTSSPSDIDHVRLFGAQYNYRRQT